MDLVSVQSKFLRIKDLPVVALPVGLSKEPLLFFFGPGPRSYFLESEVRSPLKKSEGGDAQRASLASEVWRESSQAKQIQLSVPVD